MVVTRSNTFQINLKQVQGHRYLYFIPFEVSFQNNLCLRMEPVEVSPAPLQLFLTNVEAGRVEAGRMLEERCPLISQSCLGSLGWADISGLP